jgi:hypothetical protein
MPGVETPNTPDGLGVLDAGDGVEAPGVDGWRQVRQVRRVGGWFPWRKGNMLEFIDELVIPVCTGVANACQKKK